MKMEMWLCAEAAGAVKALHVKVGDQVESGAVLVELELTTTKEA
jgi:geranyl-CoA carboxylase alpha subunit